MRDELETGKLTEVGGSFAHAAQRVVTVDIDKYQEYLDGSGMSAEEKEEFLKAVWSVVMVFVDLGFGVHPLQEVCGKDGDADDQRPCVAFDKVKSDDPKKLNY